MYSGPLLISHLYPSQGNISLAQFMLLPIKVWNNTYKNTIWVRTESLLFGRWCEDRGEGQDLSHPCPEPPALFSLSSPLHACMLSHVRLFSNAMDSSLPGSPVPGILQARILQWIAISFSTFHCMMYSKSTKSAFLKYGASFSFCRS